MPTPPISDNALRLTLGELRDQGSKNKAARALGIQRSTLNHRLRLAEARGLTAEGEPRTVLPITLPSASLTDSELWDRVAADYERNARADEAKRWHAVQARSNEPMGVCWFGDPHLDDGGTDIPLLRRHMATVAGTPGMMGANIGDSTNNWVGRLVRLYAEQSVTRAAGLQLAESFLMRSGIEWLMVLIGNHDAWGSGAELLKLITRNVVPLYDWQAQIRLTFPNGRVLPIWAAHDFRGHSQWNPLHGPMKAAQFSGQAALYVCGHKHNWALFSGEDAQRGGIYHLARARGYKSIDAYADNAGFGRQQSGASIVSVIDPEAKSEAGFLRCFADVEDGADFLGWLRARAGLKDRKH